MFAFPGMSLNDNQNRLIDLPLTRLLLRIQYSRGVGKESLEELGLKHLEDNLIKCVWYLIFLDYCIVDIRF